MLEVLHPHPQAIDELKEHLFRARVEYTEETLVIVGNNTIEGLSKDTFVSIILTAHFCFFPSHFTQFYL